MCQRLAVSLAPGYLSLVFTSVHTCLSLPPLTGHDMVKKLLGTQLLDEDEDLAYEQVCCVANLRCQMTDVLVAICVSGTVRSFENYGKLP